MITEAGLIALLTIERFAAWLDAQAEDAVVGRAGDADGCPLARYLIAEAPALCADVSGADIFVATPDATIRAPTPRWAAVFVATLDHGSDELEQIPATRAQYVLLQVRKELAQ